MHHGLALWLHLFLSIVVRASRAGLGAQRGSLNPLRSTTVAEVPASPPLRAITFVSQSIDAVTVSHLWSRISLQDIAHEASEQEPADRKQGRCEQQVMLTNTIAQGLRSHIVSGAGNFGAVAPGAQISTQYGNVNTGSRCLRRHR